MALGDLTGLLDPLIQSASGMSMAFVPAGQILLSMSVAIALLFAAYEWWLGSGHGAMSKLVRAGLVLTLPAILLHGDNYQKVGEEMTDFFSVQLTKPLLGTSSVESASAGAGIQATIDTLQKSMFPNARKAADERSAYEKVRDFLKSDQTIGGALFSNLTQAMFELLLFLLAVILSVALIFAIYGPLLALHIGVIFGPLLFCWLPLPSMSHLARSWLSFMISQGLTLVVGICMALIAANTLTIFSEQMTAIGAGANGMIAAEELFVKIGGFMASAAVILFVAIMLFRADSIAGAMVGGGGGGTSGAGAAIMRGVTPRMPAVKGIGSIKPKPTPK